MTPPASPPLDARALRAAGQTEAALEQYEKTFLQSVYDQNTCAMLTAVRQIGYTYQLLGEASLAQEYLQLACTLATIHGDHGQAARALNGLGTIFQHSGHISSAETSYLSARALAEGAEDQLALADIEQNLGTLASVRGRYDEAAQHYETSLAVYREIGHGKGVAQVLHNLGMLMIDVGEVTRAAELISTALRSFVEQQDSGSAGAAYLNLAEAHLHAGALNDARGACDCAFEIAALLDDPRLRAEAHKYYGMIFKAGEQFDLAESHLRQAAMLADAYEFPLTEAESLRELALALRALDRNGEALHTLNQALRLFTELQARGDQADVAGHLKQLERDFQEIVTFWSSSIERKDQYTRDHCQRVADYACVLAMHAGFPEQEMVWFRMGAILHDIGKVEVPESILHKQGVLTATERKIVERHTTDGDQLLSALSFPWDVRPMIRSHHERWDGNGYPDGLIGEAIPLEARILKLADVFDALTSSRSYRQRLSAEEARELMREDNGAFDPHIFAQFEDIFPHFCNLLMRDSSSDLTVDNPAVL